MKKKHLVFLWIICNLQPELEKNNIKLLIEPINTIDIPGFYLNTVSQAKKVMEAVNSSNLFLQYDIYHTQIMEGDILRKLEAN